MRGIPVRDQPLQLGRMLTSCSPGVCRVTHDKHALEAQPCKAPLLMSSLAMASFYASGGA